MAEPVGDVTSLQEIRTIPDVPFQKSQEKGHPVFASLPVPQRKPATPAGQRSAEIHSGASPELVRREPAESVRLKRRNRREHLVFSIDSIG